MKTVFLLYDSRSGSTFLSSRLDAYDDFFVTIESNYMRALLLHEKQLPHMSPPEVFDFLLGKERVSNLKLDRQSFEQSLKAAGRVDVASVHRAVLDAQLVDPQDKDDLSACFVKDGANGLWVHKVHQCIPDALFVHVARDGRAVYNSKNKTLRPYAKGRNMSRDPLTAARVWSNFVDTVDDFARAHVDSVLQVRYEQLILDPEAVVSDIRRFVGAQEDMSTSESEYAGKIPEREKGIHSLVGRDADQSRLEGWRREADANELIVFDHFARQSLQRYGYTPMTHGVRDLLRWGPLAVIAKSCMKRWADRCRYLLSPRIFMRIIQNKLLLKNG